MLWSLFLIFAKIGMFTFGGGPAMLPLIQQALLERGWMTMLETIDIVAISQMTPGPFAVNAATFSGMRMHGISGAIIATFGVMLPSIVIVSIVAHYFFRVQKSTAMQSVLKGVRPVIPALISASLWSMGKASLMTGSNYVPLLTIALTGAGLVLYTKINPAWIILFGGIFGAVFL